MLHAVPAMQFRSRPDCVSLGQPPMVASPRDPGDHSQATPGSDQLPAQRQEADVNEAKTALGHKIVALKKKKKWSWAEVAAKLDHAPVWVCAACLGQMSMTEATAEKAGVLFDLSDDEVQLLQEPPYRGSLPTAVPTDPLVYRFY